MSVERRRQMIEREHAPVDRGAVPAGVDQPVVFPLCPCAGDGRDAGADGGESTSSFLDHPWCGSRQMARHLQRLGHAVSRGRVRRLMAKIRPSPIYQRPRTGDPHPRPVERLLQRAAASLPPRRPNAGRGRWAGRGGAISGARRGDGAHQNGGVDQPGYSLAQPPNCPGRRDHLNRLLVLHDGGLPNVRWTVLGNEPRHANAL